MNGSDSSVPLFQPIRALGPQRARSQISAMIQPFPTAREIQKILYMYRNGDHHGGGRSATMRWFHAPSMAPSRAACLMKDVKATECSASGGWSYRAVQDESGGKRRDRSAVEGF